MHLRTSCRRLHKRLKPQLSSSNGKDLALTGLRQLKESSDAFPPLKSAVGAVLQIFVLSDDLKYQREAAEELCLRCHRIIGILEAFVISLPSSDPKLLSPPFLSDLERFDRVLHNILSEMQSLQKKQTSLRWRISHLNRTRDTLSRFQSELDESERSLTSSGALALSGAFVRLPNTSIIFYVLLPKILYKLCSS
ncbi:hypothetical protein DL96DRAFT_1642738 [Flagelloscypha sp. PMI_526]|nr:hypothetical protein DL96DRAFT_1642738 [Flagelloscypha sp. PMI_526]